MLFSDIPRIPESSHPPLESSEYTLCSFEHDLVLGTVIFCYEFLECLPCIGRQYCLEIFMRKKIIVI